MKKIFSFFAIIMCMALMSCTPKCETRMIEAYEKATADLKASTSEEEAVEINKALFNELVEIFVEDKDAFRSVQERKSKKVKEAYNAYWDQMKESAPSYKYFITNPDLYSISLKINHEEEDEE